MVWNGSKIPPQQDCGGIFEPFHTLPVDLLKNGQQQLGQSKKTKHIPAAALLDNKMTQLKDRAEVAATPFSAHVPTSSMRMAKNLTLFKVSEGYILTCGSVHDLKLQPD